MSMTQHEFNEEVASILQDLTAADPRPGGHYLRKRVERLQGELPVVPGPDDDVEIELRFEKWGGCK